MDYKIITSTSTDELENKVKQMIKQGWKPIGGVSIGTRIVNDNYKLPNLNQFKDMVMYIQTIIKDDVQ
jgi:hypothetical protein